MADEKKEAAPEIVKNCAGCKKPVKKSRRYFRDGKYYCNYSCWRKVRPAKETAETKPAEV